MKKLLLVLVSIILILPTLKAKTPEAIYIATWEKMDELGKPITPKDTDPKLSYNESTGCYEGEILNWPKLQVNPYIAKIPYSVEDDVITYYGVPGTTQQLVFNTHETALFKFEANTSPASFKGFGIGYTNNEAVVDVKVSVNLDKNEISFTRFESNQSAEIPTLLEVDPVNGTEITLNEEGGVEITLTFSGPVTSMDVISEDTQIVPEVNDDGTVWILPVPAAAVAYSALENQGKLLVKIQKVYAHDLPVSFNNGSLVLGLEYTISGVTSIATLNFTGDTEGLKTLNVYKAPEYSVGDQVDFEGESLEVTYTTNVTYLITVGSGYEVSINSDVASNNDENWKLGVGYSTAKNENGESTNTPVAQGATLTLFSGASGATFTITVSEKEAGVESLISEQAIKSVYNLSGNRLKVSDVKDLPSGLYIINGKKVMIK